MSALKFIVLFLPLCLGSTTISKETTTVDWRGAWNFEKEWFDRQHPFLPWFIKKIALESTLILDDSYHQVNSQGDPLKAKRPLVVKSLQANQAILTRIEGNKPIEFRVEKRNDNQVYYCEGKSVYKIQRPSISPLKAASQPAEVVPSSEEKFQDFWEPEF